MSCVYSKLEVLPNLIVRLEVEGEFATLDLSAFPGAEVIVTKDGVFLSFATGNRVQIGQLKKEG